MNRKLILSKNAILWETGETARNIAIVEKGRLGVRAGQLLIGVIPPRMILGEAALLGTEPDMPRRTATVFALEDDTQVTEYSPALVRKMFDLDDPAIAMTILRTLVGQVGKHCLLIVSANKDYPLIREITRETMRGVIQASRELPSVKTWDAFMRVFSFLVSLRDALSGLSQAYLGGVGDRAELVDRSSAMVRQLLGGEDQDLARTLEEFIGLEKERDTWLER